ncbi:MAG: hypothetical protein KA341_02210 [Saprospiraceae bacterium]|jgi:hypothetical protein|nr:hypothetical protein [Saprospiraceae bacterium]
MDGKSILNRYVKPEFGGSQRLLLESYIHQTQGIRFLKISDNKCSISKGFSILD